MLLLIDVYFIRDFMNAKVIFECNTMIHKENDIVGSFIYKGETCAGFKSSDTVMKSLQRATLNDASFS